MIVDRKRHAVSFFIAKIVCCTKTAEFHNPAFLWYDEKRTAETSAPIFVFRKASAAVYFLQRRVIILERRAAERQNALPPVAKAAGIRASHFS